MTRSVKTFIRKSVTRDLKPGRLSAILVMKVHVRWKNFSDEEEKVTRGNEMMTKDGRAGQRGTDTKKGIFT